jgi:Arc/MetJ-type ribon-helix-helix transcriptional regulator
MTSTITVRLSEEERKELAKHGRISDVVREALTLYLRDKDSRRIIRRLRELQKTSLQTTIQEDLRMLRADRNR